VLSLEAKLRADPRVTRVTYISKEQALKRAQSQPGLADLASATGNNPFPASLDIKVRRIEDLAAVDALVKREAQLDPQLQTSYDPGAYTRLGQLILVLTVAGIAVLGLLAAVAVGLTGASVRGVVVARKEELRALDLLGAPGWVLRAPFVTQGALTGVLAGVVAAVCVLGLFSAEAQAARVNVMQWLPSLATETALVAGGLLALSGMTLGALSSLTELRRL
jgi:cell division transport system permease protein